jgi:MoaA/NifB/PqqE/SkfB family radical SAM enzyme
VIQNIKGWAFLQTNGLSDKDYEVIIPQLHEINFSVDAATKETYEYIRGPHFDQVIRHIRKAVDIRQQQPNHNPRIYMDFVLMQCNKHEILPFIELAQDIEARGVYFCPLFPSPEPLIIDRGGVIFNYSEQVIPRDELIELLTSAKNRAAELSIECGGHVY